MMEEIKVTRNYFIIVNPKAGGGNVKKLWPKIYARLNDLGLNFETFFTQYAGHAVELSQQILTKIFANNIENPIIVIAGGDGTLHETVRGCFKYFGENPDFPQVPIAVLPVGSGNDFARTAHIPARWEAALESILNNDGPRELTIGHYTDLLTNNEGVFVNNFGIGFDASVVNVADQSELKSNRFISRFSYMGSVLKVLTTFKGFPIEFKIPDRNIHFKKTFLFTITNIPYFGGGINIVPQASLFDNHLDLVIIEKPSIIHILTIVATIFFKKHLSLGYVHHYSLESFIVNSKEKNLAQVDGEVLSKPKFSLKYDTKKYLFWIK